MDIVAICGNSTNNLSVAAFWDIEKDTEEQGRQLVKFKLLPGADRFVSGHPQIYKAPV